MESQTVLPLGYSRIPQGKIVNAVTCLEMLNPPSDALETLTDHSFDLVNWHDPDLAEYRALFRAVGGDWLWASRLTLTDAALSAILNDPNSDIHVLHDAGRPIGLLELDFRVDFECELAYFGLVADAIGNGVGRWLMNQAIALAWSRPIRRFWVHTCHFDHPNALAFYQRSGFRPYAMMVEVMDDPRHSGVLPPDAAPHVPLLPAAR